VAPRPEDTAPPFSCRREPAIAAPCPVRRRALWSGSDDPEVEEQADPDDDEADDRDEHRPHGAPEDAQATEHDEQHADDDADHPGEMVGKLQRSLQRQLDCSSLQQTASCGSFGASC